MSVIHVERISKTYGRTVAIADVSFDVEPGEIPYPMVGLSVFVACPALSARLFRWQ